MLFRFQLTKPDILFINILLAVSSVHLGRNLQEEFENKLRAIKNEFEYWSSRFQVFLLLSVGPYFFLNLVCSFLPMRVLWHFFLCAKFTQDKIYGRKVLVELRFFYGRSINPWSWSGTFGCFGVLFLGARSAMNFWTYFSSKNFSLSPSDSSNCRFLLTEVIHSSASNRDMEEKQTLNRRRWRCSGMSTIDWHVFVCKVSGEPLK